MLILSRYPPICRGAGEDSCDEQAFERNMDLMRKELEREESRKENLIRLMKLTYPVRREYILSDSSEVSATTILEQYRALTNVPVASELCNIRIIICITVLLFKSFSKKLTSSLERETS